MSEHQEDIKIEINDNKDSSNKPLINRMDSEQPSQQLQNTQNQEEVGDEQQNEEEKKDAFDSQSSGGEGEAEGGGEEEEHDEYPDDGNERTAKELEEAMEEQNQLKLQKQKEDREARLTQIQEWKKEFLENIQKEDDDDNIYDQTGNQGLKDCIKKVREIIKESQQYGLELKEHADLVLEEGQDLITNYMKISNNKGESQLFFLRSEIFLRMNKFIQALHDYEEGCILDQTIETAKSSFEHYKITQSLMRMSNDV